MTKWMRMKLIKLFFAFSVGCAAALCAAQSQAGWTVYNGGPDGDHYSPLDQINRGNVQELQMATPARRVDCSPIR